MSGYERVFATARHLPIGQDLPGIHRIRRTRGESPTKHAAATANSMEPSASRRSAWIADGPQRHGALHTHSHWHMLRVREGHFDLGPVYTRRSLGSQGILKTLPKDIRPRTSPCVCQSPRDQASARLERHRASGPSLSICSSWMQGSAGP